MKKIFLSIALVFTAGATVTFAQNSKTTDAYLQASFKENFSAAKDISWKQTKNYNEATFTIDGQVLTAYYNETKHPFAISRNITPSQLPLLLLGDIKRNYADYWISGLFELMVDGHSEYYITLEKADKKIIMKSDDSSMWSAYNPLSASL
ncbi:MAG: hypothetical protein WDO19_06630 [Bacteroidota bacterium]